MNRKREEIQSLKEIPQGMSEAEEAKFWATHELGEGVELEAVAAEDSELPPARTPTSSTRISIVFENDTLKRLKRIARAREMGYQTLLKTFVSERLYEEEKGRR